jgi:hypothetical protein
LLLFADGFLALHLKQAAWEVAEPSTAQLSQSTLLAGLEKHETHCS